MAADPAEICRRMEELRQLRFPHEETWADCFDHSFPIRSYGLSGSTFVTINDTRQRKALLLDSTSTDAGNTLAASTVGGLTPENSPWVGVAVPGFEQDDEADGWLHEASGTLQKEIHNANFDSMALECMLDEIGAGWFALYIDIDRERGGFMFEQWALSQVYCAASRAGGPVDIVYRYYCITAQQAMSEFGDQLSDKTKQLAKDKPQESVEFIHAIYPRHIYAPDARLSRNLPIASCHVEVSEKKLVREGGYHEMPVVIVRWSKIPKSEYGIGPMFDALPDIKELNELKLMEKQAASLNILPPFKATDDGVLNVGAIKKLQSGKIYTVNDIDNFQPIMNGSNFQLALTSEEQLKMSIRRTLMADQLGPQDGPAKTATEIHARIGLIRQLLGPRYGRLQAEWIKPMVVRCFGLAYRAGILGEAPPQLAGQLFQVEYISPLARAQKLEDVSAIERWNQNVGAISQFVPDALDNVDSDEEVRILADALRVPAKAVRQRKAVTALRQARQQQQQQAQQQAQQQEVGMMAAQSMAKRMEKAA